MIEDKKAALKRTRKLEADLKVAADILSSDSDWFGSAEDRFTLGQPQGYCAFEAIEDFRRSLRKRRRKRIPLKPRMRRQIYQYVDEMLSVARELREQRNKAVIYCDTFGTVEWFVDVDRWFQEQNRKLKAI